MVFTRFAQTFNTLCSSKATLKFLISVLHFLFFFEILSCLHGLNRNSTFKNTAYTVLMPKLYIYIYLCIFQGLNSPHMYGNCYLYFIIIKYEASFYLHVYQDFRNVPIYIVIAWDQHTSANTFNIICKKILPTWLLGSHAYSELQCTRFS